MSLKVICVGTELLEGRSVNTNLAFVGSQLSPYGIAVDAEVTIPDTPDVIEAELMSAIASYDAVITVGGLGPTRDDMTKEVVARALGLELTLDTALLDTIADKFKHRNRKVSSDSMKKQATVPTGAEVLANDWGIAPGLCMRSGEVMVCMLPGPPREFQPIFTNHVLPRLREHLPTGVLTRTLRVIGIGESTVARQADPLIAEYPGIEVGYCVKPGAIDITISAPPQETATLDTIESRLADCFGRHFATRDETHISRICDLLRTWNGTWGTAESCTGGWIAKRITDLSGVSDVFEGGIVSYSNRLKTMLLGVSDETLAAHGAVSEPTAREMVTGLTERYGLTAGIAVTGIAGPDGGSDEKPVGTVYIGTAVKGDIKVTHHVFPFDRRGMRERTITEALGQLWLHMLDIEDADNE